MRLSKLWEIVKDREARCAAVPWSCKASDTTQRLNSNKLISRSGTFRAHHQWFLCLPTVMEKVPTGRWPSSSSWHCVKLDQDHSGLLSLPHRPASKGWDQTGWLCGRRVASTCPVPFCFSLLSSLFLFCARPSWVWLVSANQGLLLTHPSL